MLRRSLDDLSPGETRRLAGLRGDLAGRKLQLVHRRPHHPLTPEEPARKTTAFRSKPPRRYTLFKGQPRMRRRAPSRAQVGANPLVQCSHRVAPLGEEVGFDSEAARNRAFKKPTGSAPGTWRKTRRTART